VSLIHSDAVSYTVPDEVGGSNCQSFIRHDTSPQRCIAARLETASSGKEPGDHGRKAAAGDSWRTASSLYRMDNERNVLGNPFRQPWKQLGELSEQIKIEELVFWELLHSHW
jgi:hypothetical protein